MLAWKPVVQTETSENVAVALTVAGGDDRDARRARDAAAGGLHRGRPGRRPGPCTSPVLAADRADAAFHRPGERRLRRHQVAELVVARCRELLLARRRDRDRAGTDRDRRQRLVDDDRHAAGRDVVARVGHGDLERVASRPWRRSR